MEFANNGVVTIMEYGKTNQVTYELSAIGGSQDSITITINDSDGNGSSETAVFKDENTMVIGDTIFERANAGGNE